VVHGRRSYARLAGSVAAKILASLVCFCSSAPTFAEPATPPSIDLSIEEASGLAARWLSEGNLEQAERILGLLRKADPDDPQVLFLEGQLALQKRDYPEAVRIFRGLLTRNPSLTRVRLELARALFLAQDYDAARYHFELVLGGDLPEGARDNVFAYLRAIYARTTRFNLTAVIGPDSNPTFATSAQTIQIGGNSYILNPDARARSAIGLVALAQGRFVFGEENRNFVRAAAEVRQFPGSYADFGYLEATLGRSFVTGESIWTTEAGPLGSQYQDRELYRGALVRLTHARPIGERFLSQAFASWRRLDYNQRFDYLSGNQGWLGTTLRYAIDPTSGTWISAALGINDAAERPYSYDAVEGAIGYVKELPSRLNAQVRVAASRVGYDAADPLFGAVRVDRLVRVDVELTARNWSFHGFAPMLLAGASWNDSSIPIYTYRRNYVSVGITREF
jgi:tetratricopeptide (TPR) repeat protein